jgi:hypothetical protein
VFGFPLNLDTTAQRRIYIVLFLYGDARVKDIVTACLCVFPDGMIASPEMVVEE